MKSKSSNFYFQVKKKFKIYLDLGRFVCLNLTKSQISLDNNKISALLIKLALFFLFS